MILPDVNVLLYAVNTGAPQHAAAHAGTRRCVSGGPGGAGVAGTVGVRAACHPRRHPAAAAQRRAGDGGRRRLGWRGSGGRAPPSPADARRWPRYYNTLFANCTTEVARIVRAFGRRLPWAWPLVAGLVPRYFNRRGLIDDARPFEAIVAEADIGERARAEGPGDDGPAYSARIRAGRS